METGLADRVVMVTGASGGIGGEVVRAFVNEGARVVAHFGRHAEPAERLARELGPRCAALGADLTGEDEVVRLFAETERLFGPVEVLVANAGFWPPQDAPLADMTIDQWNATLGANLTSVFLTARGFLRSVAESGHGSLVLVGSTAGIFGEAGHADYAAAKAGLVGLLLSLKNEVVRVAPGARVNAVFPGWTESAMTRGHVDDERVRRISRTMALRKVAQPGDVARQVVVLASDELSGHLTGQIVTVAGGMEGRVVHDE